MKTVIVTKGNQKWCFFTVNYKIVLQQINPKQFDNIRNLVKLFVLCFMSEFIECFVFFSGLNISIRSVGRFVVFQQNRSEFIKS